MPPTTTSIRITTIVVLFIALDSLVCVGTLAYCLIAKIEPDPTLITAFVGVTGALVGALTGLLVNTRTQADHTAANPVSVQVENKPNDPVPTESIQPHITKA